MSWSACFHDLFGIDTLVTQIGSQHHKHQLLKRNRRFPSQPATSFRGIPNERINFSGAIVLRIGPDEFVVVQSYGSKGELAKLAYRVVFPSGDDKIVGLRLLQHQPHGMDVILGVTPVPLGIQIPQIKLSLLPGHDAGHRLGNLAGDKGLPPARALMIEEDPVGGIEAVSFPVIDREPVGEDLGTTVRTSGIESRGFSLWIFPALPNISELEA